MAQFKAFAPRVEVNGQTVSSIIEGMGAFKPTAVKILSAHGIKDIRSDSWHSQQAWLDAFAEIAKTVGNATLIQIGKKIPECAKFPPQVNSLETALQSIDVAYHMNHRGGEIGHYAYQKTGPTTARMVCNNPYPCDFDKGIVLAMVARFGAGRSAQVIHDQSAECRRNGANSCTFLVQWV